VQLFSKEAIHKNHKVCRGVRDKGRGMTTNISDGCLDQKANSTAKQVNSDVEKKFPPTAKSRESDCDIFSLFYSEVKYSVNMAVTNLLFSSSEMNNFQ
jgi:hypothetical protein